MLSQRALSSSQASASTTSTTNPLLHAGRRAHSRQCRYATIPSATSTDTSQRRTRTASDLNDPAQIGATGQASVKVKNFPSPVSLTNYMLLPVEQYFVLDPNQIKHLGGNRFLLFVPRINILNVWLEPEVEVVVTTVPGPSPKVVLQAENARIKGSEVIQNLRIDSRFCMQFRTELQWTTGQAGLSSVASGNSFDGGEGLGEGEIRGAAQLDVWCEVIPPFNLMPREVLQGSCNVVMSGLVNTLLPLFMRKLGDDYQKWAVDSAYRLQRATRQVLQASGTSAR